MTRRCTARKFDLLQLLTISSAVRTLLLALCLVSARLDALPALLSSRLGRASKAWQGVLYKTALLEGSDVLNLHILLT